MRKGCTDKERIRGEVKSGVILYYYASRLFLRITYYSLMVGGMTWIRILVGLLGVSVLHIQKTLFIQDSIDRNVQEMLKHDDLLFLFHLSGIQEVCF